MPKLPRKPRPGEVVEAQLAVEIIDFLRSLIPHGNSKRLRVQHSPSGVLIAVQPEDEKPRSFFAEFSNKNEFAADGAGVDLDITGGRVYGYYASVTIADKSIPADGAKDVWVEITTPHDAGTLTAVLKDGTYPGTRTASGAGDDDQINISIGSIVQSSTGNLRWDQEWLGGILVPTLFWPGEHPENIALDQSFPYVAELLYTAANFDLKVTNRTERNLKGLLSEVVTATEHIDFTPADESITGEQLDPDIAGDGLSQDVDGNLQVNVFSDQFEIDSDVIKLLSALAAACLSFDVDNHLQVNLAAGGEAVVTNVSFNEGTGKFEQTKRTLTLECVLDEIKIVAGPAIVSTVYTAEECPTTTTTTT